MLCVPEYHSRGCDAIFTGHSLDGELELLALEHTRVVHVEEVAVEDRLNQSRNDRNPIGAVLGFSEVAVDPVGDVQRTVAAEREEIMGRDGLGLAGALQHEELGQDGDGFEPDGERPQDFGEGVFVGEDDGEDGGASEEVLDFEGVDIGVVGGLVGVGHEVDDVALAADEEDLEQEIVDALG